MGPRAGNKVSRSYPRGVGLDFRKLTGLTLLSYIDHHVSVCTVHTTFVLRAPSHPPVFGSPLPLLSNVLYFFRLCQSVRKLLRPSWPLLWPVILKAWKLMKKRPLEGSWNVWKKEMPPPIMLERRRILMVELLMFRFVNASVPNWRLVPMNR